MAITNLNDFRRWIRETTSVEIPRRITLFQKSLVLDLFRRLVLISPVGNPALWKNPSLAPPGYVGGHFRANWQVTVGTPATDEVPGVTKPSEPVLANIRPFAKVWITNNVPYAERLEMGWSTQAPAGIVSVAIVELQAFRG